MAASCLGSTCCPCSSPRTSSVRPSGLGTDRLSLPLYGIYLSIHVPSLLPGSGLLYNSRSGWVVINVAFQLGFCVFVLSNYMTTTPMRRPALAALATLLTT